MTNDLFHMVSLAVAMGSGALASWPQVVPWLTLGLGALIGAPLLLLLLWLGLRHDRLRRHMSLLDRAMDVVGSGVFITDAQRPGHPIVAVNPAFTRLTGYEGRALSGRSAQLLEGPETEPQAKKLVHNALRDGRSCRTTATLHARDGKPFTSDLLLATVRDRRGRHTHTIWEMRERARSHPAQLPTDSAESLIDAIARVFPQPLLVTSEQGSIETVNPAAGRLFGYEPDELQNQPVTRLLPSAKSLHDSLQTAPPEIASCETVGVRKDGGSIPLNVSSQDLLIEGQPHCVFTCEDLTRLKRDARRRATWESLADLLGTSPQLTLDCAGAVLQTICDHCEWPVGSLWTLDHEAHELRCVQTHVAAGAILDQMAGAHRRSTCKPSDGLIGRVWCTGEPEWSEDVAQELDWVPRHPTSHIGGVIAQPVKSGGSVIAVIEFFGVENPSTNPALPPLLASFAALIGQAIIGSSPEGQVETLDSRERGEAFGSLVGGIAHDLNNTLATILGFTELALPAVPAASHAQRHLKHIMNAGGRAKDLVQQVLILCRQSDQVLSAVRLQDIIQETIKLVRVALPATIELKESIEADVPPVLGDPTQLRQVLVNVCANAEDAMRGTHGTMEIELAAVSVTPDMAGLRPALREQRYARLTVRDTGCGMPARVKKHAFEPFFTTKPAGEGTGLGLAVVRGIILHHGGAISMKSTPKEGTTVDMYLPLARQQTAGEPLLSHELPRGSERVMLVEGEPALAELGRDMLESLGYEVIVRTKPLEALRAFELMPQRFDLMIMDQSMPRTTGEGLVRDVLRMCPELPVIMMLGFSHTMDAEHAHALGVRALLHKPLLLRDLALAIRQALDQPVSPSVPRGARSPVKALVEVNPEHPG